MNPDHAATLAARLNPSVCRFDTGMGGWGHLTQSDIAMALGMVKSEPARLWIRVRYCGHEEYRPELERLLLMKVVDMAAPERWKMEKPGMLRTMVKTAIHEHSTKSICSRCNGQKIVVWTEEEANERDKHGNAHPEMALKPGNCPKCKGTGYSRVSDRWRARQIGIDPSWFNRVFRSKYNRILNIVRGVDGDAKSSLADRLG